MGRLSHTGKQIGQNVDSLNLARAENVDSLKSGCPGPGCRSTTHGRSCAFLRLRLRGAVELNEPCPKLDSLHERQANGLRGPVWKSLPVVAIMGPVLRPLRSSRFSAKPLREPHCGCLPSHPSRCRTVRFKEQPCRTLQPTSPHLQRSPMSPPEPPLQPTYQRGPWQVLRSSVPYRDPWVHVVLDEVVRPDSRPGTYTVVHVKPGVCVLALDDEQNFHLTEEYHYGVDRVTIEGVSGGCEPGEDPQQTAQRELREELGLQAQAWYDYGIVDPFTANVVSPTRLYLARELTACPQQLEGTELIRHVRIPVVDFVHQVLNSQVTHSPTAILALKVAAALFPQSLLAAPNGRRVC